MKKLLFLFLLLPSVSFARFGMSLHGGFNAGTGSNAEFQNSRLNPLWHKDRSLSTSLRFFISIKHFDFGLAVERGGLHSKGKITSEDYSGNEKYSISGFSTYNSIVYTLPFLYANYKFKLAGPVYLFAGLSAGNMLIERGSSTTTFSEAAPMLSTVYTSYIGIVKRSDVSIMTGIQAGTFVKVNKDLSISLEVASRNFIVSGLTTDQQGNYPFSVGVPFANRKVTESIYYFPVNLGIRYKF